MGRRIGLVIDDDRKDREVIGNLLRRAGIEPVEVEYGPDAVCAVRTECPDVVVLDRILENGWRGDAILREIKADPSTREVPVIMVSGYGCDQDGLRNMIDAGAYSYWTKPLTNSDRFVLQLKALPIWFKAGPVQPVPDFVAAKPELTFKLLRLDMQEPVFVSYCFKDQDLVEQFVGWAEGIGIPCLYAKRDLQPASKISDTLNIQIATCGSAIVFLTPASVKSHWVKAEVSTLLRRGKTILPVRTSADVHPGDLHALLAEVLCLDIF